MATIEGQCPECKEGRLFLFTLLLISSPTSQRRFDKTGLRSADVKIVGAYRYHIHCDKCGFNIPFAEMPPQLERATRQIMEGKTDENTG
jgi:hypothetical protein